jgi:hypothetical protein
MKRVTLEIIYSDGHSEIIQLENGKFTVGREDADISLHDTVVSGLHGEINIEGSNITYTDLGSTNGTFKADGTRLTAPFSLTEGAELKMGDCKIVVKALNKPAAATMIQPAVTGITASAATASASSSGKYTRQGRGYILNIEEMFKGVVADRDWIVKMLITGLITLIPVAGMLNLMGWTVACYRNRKQGITELPAATPGYMGEGFSFFLAYLPLIGAFIAVEIVSAVIGMIIPFMFVFNFLLTMALIVYGWVASPAIMYLYMEQNDRFASMNYKAVYDLIMSNTASYFNIWLAFFVAGLVSSAGGIAIIAVIFTVPVGAVLQANALADYSSQK